MTVLGVLIAAAVGGIGAAWQAAIRWQPSRLMRVNHAGRRVPATLGVALLFGVLAGLLAGSFVTAGDSAFVVGMNVFAFFTLLMGAGLLDDLFGGSERGLRGHLGALARGRATTGILKLVVGVAVAVALALYLADDPVRVVAIAVLVATCTNLWNALDVVPGRALKWGALGLIGGVAAGWSRPSTAVLAAALGATLALLPFDLRERGMLGDAGSNPLGFLVGLGLAVVLPTPGLLVAAGAALLLQAAAETVTISRLIQAVPPLRWFDGLGRRSVPAS